MDKYVTTAQYGFNLPDAIDGSGVNRLLYSISSHCSLAAVSSRKAFQAF